MADLLGGTIQAPTAQPQPAAHQWPAEHAAKKEEPTAVVDLAK